MYLPLVENEAPKSTEELFGYVLKMRERGDDWRAVRNYLNRYSEDDELKQNIIRKVDVMEKEGTVKPPTERKGPTQWEVFIGGIVFLAGLILMIELWEKGWVATAPVLMMGAGLAGMSGTMSGFKPNR
ncbi:MAG: hypothetical protein KDC76_10995 [Bacteroidetes bacterium]|nr:hypothetical protein [Bacteroidota bacterium]